MELTPEQLKAARIAVKQNLRKIYEAGEIDRKTWRDACKKLDQAQVKTMLKEQNNEE